MGRGHPAKLAAPVGSKVSIADIVSKDEDFLYLAGHSESKVRFLWVRLGNCRTAALLAAFDRLWPLIESSLKAGDRVIEIR